MKINWKVRFKNVPWLTMFLSLIVGFVYNMLKMFDVAPAITENQVMDLIGQALTFLGLVGVLVDPTTDGIGDSKRALAYETPWVDTSSSQNKNKDEDGDSVNG